MKALRSFETALITYPVTKRHILEDLNRQLKVKFKEKKKYICLYA